MEFIEATRVLRQIDDCQEQIDISAAGRTVNIEAVNERDRLQRSLEENVGSLIREALKWIGVLECDKQILEQIARAAQRVNNQRMLYGDGSCINMMFAIREWETLTGQKPPLGEVVIEREKPFTSASLKTEPKS